MQIDHICNLNDQRLDPYRDLKKSKSTRRSDTFIVEGKWVVERLFDSSFETHSVLVSKSKIERFGSKIPDGIPILLVTDEMADRLVGFDFHRGVMACGRRRTANRITDAMLGSKSKTDGRNLIVACPQVTLPDNLGSIIRTSAALGATAVIAGSRGADPFCRRVIRVSMGNVFKIPIVEPDEFETAITQLKKEMNFDVIAAAASSDAEPLENAMGSANTCIMFGNEAHGLSQPELAIANRKVCLEMHADVDSLNVADASTVFLYHFLKVAKI